MLKAFRARALAARCLGMFAFLALASALPAHATCPPSFLSATIGSDADCIFRDYVTDGVPASGLYNPQKPQIRQWGDVIGAAIPSSLSSITGLATGIATFLATPTSANLASAVADETGSGALVFANSPAFTGSVLTSSPSGGVGYKAGAGGTVTQATSKATAVTLNKATGAITMSNAALSAATIVSFTLTDSSIAATDTLVLNHTSGGTIGSYGLNAAAAAGSAVIYVRNNTAGSLSEAIVIQFTIIKGATS